MAGAQGAELPWELGCPLCLAQEPEQLKHSGAWAGAGPCWGLSLAQVSNGKCFHLKQNLELPNLQQPAEELSHQLQVRTNVPVARTTQPLIIPSKQTNRTICQAQSLLSSSIPAVLPVPIHEKREKGCSGACALYSHSPQLCSEAHFSPKGSLKHQLLLVLARRSGQVPLLLCGFGGSWGRRCDFSSFPVSC